jgi:Lrp/AsnC family leucine-responsive transcriptional regulator
MDDTDRKIIALLSEDSRRSLADIGGLIGMSTSATNDRIRRLTASGAIRRFTVDADPKALGLGVLAFVWVGLSGSANEERFQAFATGHSAICECHHVTGAWSYLVKIRVASLDEIEPFLTEMKQQGFLARSETIIALSTVVEGPFAVAG